jgi:hypothetical protein
MHGGNWINEEESDTEMFIWNYIWEQLPKEIDVFAVPGNHEQFANQDWEDITGNERQGYKVYGDNLLLFLDTHAGELDPDYHHDGKYTGPDMEFVNQVVSEYPDKDIWIFTHFTHMPYESEAFKEFLRTNTNVKAIFHGHNHTLEVVDLGEEYHHVPLIMCGQFSYTGSQNELDQHYSFRELLLDETGNTCSYIMPELELQTGLNDEYQYVTDVEFD